MASGSDRGVDGLRDCDGGALAAIARARSKLGSEGGKVGAPDDLRQVLREISLPSIERLIEDADLRAAHVTPPARDAAFVRQSLETARAFADRVAAGDDPYRSATGEVVKAY